MPAALDDVAGLVARAVPGRHHAAEERQVDLAAVQVARPASARRARARTGRRRDRGLSSRIGSPRAPRERGADARVALALVADAGDPQRPAAQPCSRPPRSRARGCRRGAARAPTACPSWCQSWLPSTATTPAGARSRASRRATAAGSHPPAAEHARVDVVADAGRRGRARRRLHRARPARSSRRGPTRGPPGVQVADDRDPQAVEARRPVRQARSCSGSRTPRTVMVGPGCATSSTSPTGTASSPTAYTARAVEPGRTSTPGPPSALLLRALEAASGSSTARRCAAPSTSCAPSRVDAAVGRDARPAARPQRRAARGDAARRRRHRGHARPRLADARRDRRAARRPPRRLPRPRAARGLRASSRAPTSSPPTPATSDALEWRFLRGELERARPGGLLDAHEGRPRRRRADRARSSTCS